MEIVQHQTITLKQIFQENWDKFLLIHKSLVTAYMAYNVWKVMNCREPEGLGYITFSCPVHPNEICHVPKSCKSRFCSVCAKVQIDKWVDKMNESFPNCSYFHVTFTVPEQFREMLFEKRELLNAVFSAGTETLLSLDKLLGKLYFSKTDKNWGERQADFKGRNPLICRICNRVMKFVSAYYPNSLSSIKAEMDLIFS